MGLNAGDTIIAPGDPNVQVFTGNGTWNKPNGVRSVWVRVIAGGGGGGGVTGAVSGAGAAGGGGGGGYSEKLILAEDLGLTEDVTVGTGGAGGVNGATQGGTGGTSSFGSHCSATGGVGGVGVTANTTTQSGVRGGGGLGSGGDLDLEGGAGTFGTVISGVIQFGGASRGGSTPLAPESTETSSVSTDGFAGRFPGGGGSGAIAATTTRAGGAGADGVVIVMSYF